MCLQFGFVILWQKAFGAKAALKTLVKLTPGDTVLQHSTHIPKIEGSNPAIAEIKEIMAMLKNFT
jgi:hypothetical protein